MRTRIAFFLGGLCGVAVGLAAVLLGMVEGAA